MDSEDKPIGELISMRPLYYKNGKEPVYSKPSK